MPGKWVRKFAQSGAGIAGLGAAGLSLAMPGSSPVPATTIAAHFDGLHEIVMIVVMLIFVGAFGAMFYSVYAHRRGKGDEVARFHKSTAAEVIWTAIPLVILVMLAWPATRVVIAQTHAAKLEAGVEFASVAARTRNGPVGKTAEIALPVAIETRGK